MKFMILMSAGGDAWEKLSAAERQDVMDRHGAFQRALETEGKYVMSHRLAPAEQAKTVRRDADGRITVTDGSFAESKEIGGGFYIIEAASLEEAVDWAKRSRFVAGWNEVRALADG